MYKLILQNNVDSTSHMTAVWTQMIKVLVLRRLYPDDNRQQHNTTVKKLILKFI